MYLNWESYLVIGIMITKVIFFSRRGFGGHKGFHGNVGLRYYRDYSERLHYSVSPYISLADTNYMHRYFGVNRAGGD